MGGTENFREGSRAKTISVKKMVKLLTFLE
jgi:hypothetical protein